jgi:hypothetical protein
MRKPTDMLARAALLTAAILVASCAANGSIDVGRKFGLEVGMTTEEASAVMRQRHPRYEAGPSGLIPMCGGRPRGNGERLQSYATPQYDIICIFVASGRVVAIAWETPFM